MFLWIRRGYFLGKVFLTIISFLLSIVMKSSIDFSNLFNNRIDISLAKEITYDLCIGIFSAMILVWFIDEINARIQDKQLREKEVQAIKRSNKMLQSYINQYVTLFNCIATPLDKRKFESDVMLDNFSLKDMRDLHETSLLIREGFNCSSLERFLEIELELRNQIISILKEINFEYYPQLSSVLLEFIDISLKYDCRTALIGNHTLYTNNQTQKEFIRDLLENNADAFYQELLSGVNHGANMMHPYIFLYEIMKKERDVISRYKMKIAKL